MAAYAPKQSTQFCFTIYPPTFDVDGEPWPLDEPDFHPDMRALRYGWEICPDTGRGHWQGHVMFKTRKSGYLRIATTYFARFPGAHVEVSLAPQKSWEYCAKEGMVVTHGEFASQGSRHDLNIIAADIRHGRLTVEEAIGDDVQLYQQYGRGLEWVASNAMNSRPRG